MGNAVIIRPVGCLLQSLFLLKAICTISQLGLRVWWRFLGRQDFLHLFCSDSLQAAVTSPDAHSGGLQRYSHDVQVFEVNGSAQKAIREALGEYREETFDPLGLSEYVTVSAAVLAVEHYCAGIKLYDLVVLLKPRHLQDNSVVNKLSDRKEKPSRSLFWIWSWLQK